jgi:hypothetical protein
MQSLLRRPFGGVAVDINVTNQEIYAHLNEALTIWYACIASVVQDTSICSLGANTPVPKVRSHEYAVITVGSTLDPKRFM